MKALASMIGVLIVLIGVAGVIFPDALMTAGQYFVTPTGIYIAATLRIGIGLVLIFAASASRLPKTLRVVGVIILVAGLVTPLVGSDRARATLDWWVKQGSVITRVLAGIGIAIGAFTIFAFTTRRRAA
ncbi:hypothetical protein AYO41_04290 [Verrucomicrobia bacterium SCGC AG-212-E04]|nr:hypothetical protein AYO41_04290 [Verrucomicrobia bacterium SCGC AG-212-E04]